MNTQSLIPLATSLTWLVCLVVCFLKSKYWLAIIGLVAAIAQQIGLPPIGGYYILNLIYPLWLLPVFGALRLARPDSWWSNHYYSKDTRKFLRAVIRYQLVKEYIENRRGVLTSKEFKECLAALVVTAVTMGGRYAKYVKAVVDEAGIFSVPAGE